MVKQITVEEMGSYVSGMNAPFVVGMYVDELIMGYWSEVSQRVLSKNYKYQLQEIRIFDEKKELKVFQNGTELFIRDTSDYNEKEQYYYDEFHFLDIDTRKSKGAESVIATGGGKYSLPQDIFQEEDDLKDAKVLIRNYVDYYENSGQAYIYDWRIVRFCKKGGKVYE